MNTKPTNDDDEATTTTAESATNYQNLQKDIYALQITLPSYFDETSHAPLTVLHLQRRILALFIVLHIYSRCDSTYTPEPTIHSLN